jgi:TP901 family phage tail tape measure protein
LPLGVREVLLVVRAQNLASGTLRSLAGDFSNLDSKAKKAAQQQIQTGSALMATGVAIGAVGAAGLLFLGKAAGAAMDYNRQVALTKTQTYGLKITMDQLSQAGLDVARNIAVPLDQIQSGLYDIFSSMDVNLNQARYLLSNFAKEAVAGQVDLSTAERATIGIMNAYRMKVSDVSKVQDIMFNLVKFGVGTYGDFASVIGRVTGPAVRANQSFEQTAALMAFVTRNGLSAANGAASVGRALDAIGKSRSKIQDLGKTVIEALGPDVAKKLGITAGTVIKVTDASGKLLPINQIMTELGTSLGKLSPTQLNDVLTAMFKGTGGTIQAMRFFDIAIHNFGQLNGLVKDMANSKGALKAAYDTMAQTPAMKVQLLKNNFQAFMIVLGQQLLPIIGKVAGVLAEFFKKIGSLPKPVLQVIAIVLSVVSALLLLAGIIAVVAGAWLIFTAVMTPVLAALGVGLGTIALVIAAVVALAVAAYFIYKYWGPISKWFHNMWFDMWRWIDRIWRLIYKTILDTWAKVRNVFLAIMRWISANFDKWWKTHGDAIKQIWNDVWNGVATNFKAVWDLIVAIEKWGLNIVVTLAKILLAEVKLIFKIGWDIVLAIFRVAWAAIRDGFKIWWAVMVALAKIGWDLIKMVFKIAWDIIVGVFSIFIDLLTGHWKTALNDIKNLGIQIWNAIKGFFIAVWHAIDSAAHPIWNALRDFFVSLWHTMYDTAKQVWNNIKGFLDTVWGAIKSGAKTFVGALGQIWDGIRKVFAIPINFVITTVYDNGIKALWNTVMGAIGLGGLKLPNISPVKLAAGGRLVGYGGGDIIPALLEPGEAVIDKKRASRYASIFKAMGVPGFQHGGAIPGPHGGGVPSSGSTVGGFVSGIFHLAGAAGKMAVAALTGNQAAFTNALLSAIPGAKGVAGDLAKMVATLPVELFKKVISNVWKKIAGAGAGFGAGNQIVNYAMSFLGKIPYVWGGSALGPAGADCSGFVQAIYNHFGIHAPRTSEAQGAWVRRSGPAPGGLAFYHSPPGGPDPGHVAIVKDALWVISQGGGMGPTLMPLNAMPLLWTGVPPVAGLALGGIGTAPSTSLQQLAMSLLAQYGWASQWPAFNALETREASWNMQIVNPLSGAAGLAQFINGWGEYAQYGGDPTTAIGQLTAMMNYIGQRYGSPNAAWAHEVSAGWYDRGGYLRPGWNLAYNGTGKTERVLGPGIGSGMGGPVQNFYIYTHEIDPRRHAAQLGWELARRSG